MTEAEWLACDHPWFMLDYARSRAIVRKPSVRKVRLFACACCRRVWGHLKNQANRQAVEVAEQFADRLVSENQLSAAQGRTKSGLRKGHHSSHNPAHYAAAPTRNLRNQVQWCVLGGMSVATPIRPGTDRSATRNEAAVQCALLRCILGNPFLTIELDPGCRTPGVIAISQAAYEERALPSGEMQLDRLGILADALEEAGCTEADLLGHLRGPGPHVRGCWTVDLVLGKE